MLFLRKLATPSTSLDGISNTVPKRPRPSPINHSSIALLNIAHLHGTLIMGVSQRATRFVVGDHSLRSSVIAMLAQLGWSTLEDCWQNLRLILMFKIIKKLLTVPSTHLDPADSLTHANSTHKFSTIHTSTELHRKSFFPRTISEWNDLHSDSVTSPTLDCFKSAVLE